MFILIEIDGDWTVGVDWLEHIKGFRVGFIAIHIVFVKHKDFMEMVKRDHEKKIKNVLET